MPPNIHIPNQTGNLEFCYYCSPGGHKAASRPLRGQPADPQLLPHAHRHPVLLPPATQR